MSTLPKESFLALVAVGWVDKQLQRVEVTGLMRAAKEAGLPAQEDESSIESGNSQRCAQAAEAKIRRKSGTHPWQGKRCERKLKIILPCEEARDR